MRGICPLAVWRPTANFGYPKGMAGQNHPTFFVDHIMGGYKRVLDDAAWREPAGVGVHFGIGRDGSISQYTNIFDAHYGNGITGYPDGRNLFDRTNRHLAALETRPGARWQTVVVGGLNYWNLVGPLDDGHIASLCNGFSISTEHEGLNGSLAWTDEMLDASARVKQWCIEELRREGMDLAVDADMLAGHFQIDPIHRAACPGSAWPKAALLDRLKEGGDSMIRHNAIAAWFENRDFPAGVDGGEMQIAGDFTLPVTEGTVRVEAFLDAGRIAFADAVSHAYAGAVDTQEGSHTGIVDVKIAAGVCFFDCVPGTRIRRLGCLAYWKT